MKDLIRKATEGVLSQNELEDVVGCLQAGTCDSYDALLIIGRSGATQYRALVEKYLHASDDPMLARLALLVLCCYWGLTSEYKTELEGFVRKVAWDEENDVRVLAISIAGSLLSKHPDDRLLRPLIEIFRDQTETKPQILREVAYCALALASGKPKETLPKPSRHFDLERDVDPEVIAYINAEERRLAESAPAGAR